MINRLDFIKSIGPLLAVVVIPGASTPKISDYRYSVVWMEEEQITREFTTPHKSSWLASLEYTIAGEDWACYQFIDNLEDEPKVKEFFFRAMHRKAEGRG